MVMVDQYIYNPNCAAQFSGQFTINQSCVNGAANNQVTELHLYKYLW